LGLHRLDLNLHSISVVATFSCTGGICTGGICSIDCAAFAVPLQPFQAVRRCGKTADLVRQSFGFSFVELCIFATVAETQVVLRLLDSTPHLRCLSDCIPAHWMTTGFVLLNGAPQLFTDLFPHMDDSSGIRTARQTSAA
jgi:hypothetical protein